MKKKRKFATILLFIVISTFLTGCKTGKISKEQATWNYNERIECVEVINKHDGEISVNLDVILIGKDNVILYKENYKNRIIQKDESLKVNLEDVKPDYISYEQVEAMEVEILNVYSYSTFLLVFIIIVSIIIGAVILIMIFDMFDFI